MPSQTSHYHSFLLRIWCNDNHAPWRIELEDPHTGERRRFATMKQLVKFLDGRLEGLPFEVPLFEEPAHKRENTG